ncbi:PAS domain-containing protein [uncultured Pseudodesulfovibrio sp.]|uniref:PAS domain-containing protein n=1 Tax=uncultured Pseudodesulfovibrio sp. TaxID=2035858 RepID=UPI0029C8A228|nr:PAS domain-containing protein [uncultured Pseudodesulfovibrio sp.]
MSFHGLQEFFDQSRDIMGVVDPGLRYISVNQEYCRYWGVSREDILGLHVSSVVGEDAYFSGVEKYLRQCLEGEYVHFETWIEYPLLGRRLMDVKYAPYRGEDGDILGVFLLGRDVTETRELHVRVEEERNRFDVILNSLNVGLILCDADLTIEWHNRQMQELFPGVALQGAKCRTIVERDSDECTGFSALETLQTGDPHNEEFFYRPTGRWYVMTTVRVEGKSRDQAQILGHFEDVTEQKRAWEAVLESEQRFRVIFENVNMIAVQGYDSDRRVVYWNPASEQLYGFSREEATGQLLEDLIIPEPMRDVVIAGHEAWLADGPAIPAGELELVHKDGSPVPVYSSHVMQKTTLDEKFMYCLDVDLSEIKRIHNQLIVAKEQAEAANEAKSEFLANMSHEIRTPLNGIQGMLSLLLGTELDDDQKEYTQAGLDSAVRLNRLLSDILDLSRVEAGMMKVEKVSFDLYETVEQVLALFTLSFNADNVMLRCHVADDVPQFVVGDGPRLQQVLINLVGNALKYTDVGEVRLEVSLLSPVWPGEHRVFFSVVDTGIGISQDKIDILFEPFVQGSQGFSRQYQGAGLGLSICKRLVTLMGGNMSVESEVGEGSAVHLVLPFRESSSQAVEKPVDFLDEGSLLGLKVLLAEDDRVNSIVGKRLLQEAGCNVWVVSNGMKAVELLRRQEFDAVFMDVQMPVMDGIAATKVIRNGIAGASRCDIPIYALTAYTMAGDREKLLDAGMDGYIPKPVEMEYLLKSLRNIAQKKSRAEV